MQLQKDSIALQKTMDSLELALGNAKDDTSKVLILDKLSFYCSSEDSTLSYQLRALSLAEKIKFHRELADLSNDIGNYYWNVSNYPKAIGYYLEGLKAGEEANYEVGVSRSLGNLGNVYLSIGNYRQSLNYSFKSKKADEAFHRNRGIAFDLTTISKAYSGLNMPDSALVFAYKAYETAMKTESAFIRSLSLQSLGDIFSKKGNTSKALDYYQKALQYSLDQFPLGTSEILQSLAELYQKTGQSDSSIYYSKKALEIAEAGEAVPVVVKAATFLSKIYEIIDEHKSLHYLQVASDARDDIFNNEKNNQLQNLAYNEELRQKDKITVELRYRSDLKFYGSVGGLAVLGIIALILLRNNRQRKKANAVLKNQKQEIQNTLIELKATQSQLIQSEKMASLGELTAGIAHEIQNPLNFVNNFSEVSNELIDEMNAEIEKGEIEEAKAIANDIKQNLEKINHHGKRADAIVKNMLQHSKSTSLQKELTDINKLADEYLRLSYHGFNAKDKDFNATINTDFDESNGKINIIPQNIGRVLLNLFNNAFYAVNEKSKQSIKGYNPTVSVQTKKLHDQNEKLRSQIMVMAFLKKSLTKSFNHSSPPNPPGREPA